MTDAHILLVVFLCGCGVGAMIALMDGRQG